MREDADSVDSYRSGLAGRHSASTSIRKAADRHLRYEVALRRRGGA